MGTYHYYIRFAPAIPPYHNEDGWEVAYWFENAFGGKGGAVLGRFKTQNEARIFFKKLKDEGKLLK